MSFSLLAGGLPAEPEQTAKPEQPPVKVFVLAGQSNMVGAGRVEGDPDHNDGQGSLSYLVEHQADTFGHLKQGDDWAERDDVSIWYLGKTGMLRPGFGSNDNTIGPELGFGGVVGDATEAPVLLIKIAWGGKSLGADFRPPSAGGKVGPFYTQLIDHATQTLENAETLFPEYEGRDFELVGFGWHQGWNDRINQQFNDEYEENLVHFMNDIRRDLDAPELPFVVAETGMTGPEEKHPRALSLMAAQKAACERDGHATFVPTRDFWRPEDESPSKQGYHWNSNAETYYLIGQAMGEAMLKLTAGNQHAVQSAN